MVAHFMVSGAYMSDMTTRTVSEYMGESSIVKVVKDLSRRGVRECIVYDAAEKDNRLSTCLLPLEWGMLVVTPPDTKIYGHWASERRAARIVVDCPDESDAEAMCAWMKRDQPVQQQAECWREVRGQMDAAGPLLRHIFGKRHYNLRIEKCHSVGDGTNSSRSRCYFGFEYLKCGLLIRRSNMLRRFSEYGESAMVSRLSMHRYLPTSEAKYYAVWRS
ncbi:putative retrotransposon hot spot (RHS) protein [Trypanosoma cruzi]|uniref:Putative retrotransposon hot spot (RHS) protein n=1 Tax=Trypanosoma cruzi TaxID=5693 RepID=A0A2V2UH97_TRYCR|nr:putative retrotransposon hot spot (RHS) protein [Trypanosoma cruzi]